jgi:nicotinamidase/pyrazinamidase
MASISKYKGPVMKSLLLIDIQNDFLPGGALAVPEGDSVIPIANRLMRGFEEIVATQDWHPANHGSFAANHPGKKPGDTITLSGLPQILWPVHCVQNTAGADFAAALDQFHITHITRKGTDPAIDSYSGFFDNGHRGETDLHRYLQARDITDVFIAGLATDYCVKFTALDARALGYRVHLVIDACRGVNMKDGDVDRAILAMRQAGVAIEQSSALEA